MLTATRADALHHPPIQINCSPEEMTEIVARIAREWRRFGETEPHWSVLTGDQYRSENISDNLETFYSSGHIDVANLLRGVARAGRANKGFVKALDFGCGVGRLVLALAGRANHVVGVDISSGHIRLAEQRAVAAGIDNVSFQAIQSLDDLDELSGFDLITSYLVIQHNPPPAQAEIIRKLLRALVPGGIAILQMPTWLAHAQTFDVAEYLRSSAIPMEMNAIPQHEVFSVIHESGCVCLDVVEDGTMGALHGSSYTFTIERRATFQA